MLCINLISKAFKSICVRISKKRDLIESILLKKAGSNSITQHSTLMHNKLIKVQLHYKIPSCKNPCHFKHLKGAVNPERIPFLIFFICFFNLTSCARRPLIFTNMYFTTRTVNHTKVRTLLPNNCNCVTVLKCTCPVLQKICA